MIAEQDHDGVVDQSALLKLRHDLADELVRHQDARVVDAQVLIRDSRLARAPLAPSISFTMSEEPVAEYRKRFRPLYPF